MIVRRGSERWTERRQRERERKMVRRKEQKIFFISFENISFIYKDVNIAAYSQIVDLTS